MVNGGRCHWGVQDEDQRPLTCGLCDAAPVVAAAASCGGSTTAVTRQLTSSGDHRIGGGAGVRDVLVAAGDGLVSATRKAQTPQRCQLGAGHCVAWERRRCTC
jgi:hypothetical protein